MDSKPLNLALQQRVSSLPSLLWPPLAPALQVPVCAVLRRPELAPALQGGLSAEEQSPLPAPAAPAAEDQPPAHGWLWAVSTHTVLPHLQLFTPQHPKCSSSEMLSVTPQPVLTPAIALTQPQDLGLCLAEPPELWGGWRVRVKPWSRRNTGRGMAVAAHGG